MATWGGSQPERRSKLFLPCVSGEEWLWESAILIRASFSFNLGAERVASRARAPNLLGL